MGRRKIEIQPITHERNRSVTFLKRKNGLFKKAYELGVLCSVDVAVIVFEERPGHHLKLYQYGSSEIHDIIQRQLHHEGEKDTRGPPDFSGNALGTKIGDGGEAEEDDVDEEIDDIILPIRGSKRRGDGQLKQSNASDFLNSDLDYASRMTLSHPQQPRLLPPSLSMSQQQHQHPISSDRLGPMQHHQSNKKPRIVTAPSPGPAHSGSSSDDPMHSSSSPVSGRRSVRYPHGVDALGRNFEVSSYLPHHTPHSVHPHPPSSAPHHHNHHRNQHPQYTPFFTSSAPGGYGQGGGTPPTPSFIPLQSQADFTTSARVRSASASSSGLLPQRNVYGSYGGDNHGPGGGAGGGGAAGGAGGAGPGGSGDFFAAFIDTDQQARAGLARRNSTTSGPGVGAGGNAFGLDWPVHVPPVAAANPGGGDGPSKPGSQSSSERGVERERDSASAGSGGSGDGNGGGGGNGTDWLDFLSSATTNGNGASTG